MLDQTFLADIRSIRWFAHCGERITTDIPLVVRGVTSWQKAADACTTLEYDDITLEARNRLTVFLHLHARSEYQNWNKITEAAKEQCITPLAQSIWKPFGYERGLPEGVAGHVQWDVLAAIMEHEYRHHSGRPAFFLHLLSLYRAGHFPCGWEGGPFPHGTLLVF